MILRKNNVRIAILTLKKTLGMNMEHSGNQRIDWIDTLKLIGMFYIYLGHLGAAGGKFYPFVFSFHVPLFFFISGLFYKKNTEIKGSIESIRKSFIKIVIPYIVFSIIGISIYVFKWNLPSERIVDMLISASMGIRNQVPITSLWFLPCLFVVIFYYTVANIVIKNQFLIFIFSLIIYCATPIWWNGTPSLIFNMDSALHYLPYFSFGVMISNKLKYDWPSYYEGHGKTFVLTLIAISFLYFAYSFQFGTFSLFKSISIPEVRYFIYFFVTCLMFIPSIAMAYMIDIKSFKTLGRNSILLCGTEQIVKVMVPTLLAIIGYKVVLKDPLQAILFTVICLMFSYFTVLKIYTSFSLYRSKS